MLAAARVEHHCAEARRTCSVGVLVADRVQDNHLCHVYLHFLYRAADWANIALLFGLSTGLVHAYDLDMVKVILTASCWTVVSRLDVRGHLRCPFG